MRPFGYAANHLILLALVLTSLPAGKALAAEDVDGTGGSIDHRVDKERGDQQVLTVDLDIDGLGDQDEVQIGGFVGANDGDPRKKIIVRKALPNDWGGNVVLTRNNTKVRVYNAATGGNEITFNGADNKFANGALPKDLWVAGQAGSAGLRDVELLLTAENGIVPDKVKFTVVTVNLTAYKRDGTTAVGESGEENPGAYVAYNNDDDDADGTVDKDDDADDDGIANEDDLVRASFAFGAIFDTLQTGKVVIKRDNSKIEVWKDSGKTQGNAMAFTDNERVYDLSVTEQRTAFAGEVKAKSLYVEGVASSGAVRDTGLTLIYRHANDTNICTDQVKMTVVNLDLDIDSNNDATINDADEARETANIAETSPAPYLTVNGDDDDTNGIADKGEVGPVVGENDLKGLAAAFAPNGLSTGTVTLTRDTTNIRLWSDSAKGAEKKVLFESNTKTWDLADADERAGFYGLLGNLYAEGYAAGTAKLCLSYKDPDGATIAEDDIRVSACPGAPTTYSEFVDSEGNPTWALIMSGGQLHTQWKHYSELDPPSAYMVYIHRGGDGTNPFPAKLHDADVESVPVSSTVNAPITQGFCVYKYLDGETLKERKMGAFYIHFPAPGDEGKRYWVLVRATETVDGKVYASQNTTAYSDVVDYPALPDVEPARTAAHQAFPNFYFSAEYSPTYIFWVTQAGAACDVCGKNTGNPADLASWRVECAKRVNDAANRYADFCEPRNLGANFECDDMLKLIDAFFGNDSGGAGTPDYRDCEGDGRFCMLLARDWWGGYSWPGAMAVNPYNRQTDEIRSKSNFRDMVFCTSYIQGVPSSEAFRVATAAHELQHAIHSNKDADEEPWVTEGCSTYAEHKAGSDRSGSSFAYAPAALSLSRFGREDVEDRFYEKDWPIYDEMPPGGYTKGEKIGCPKCRKYVVGGVQHEDDRGLLLLSGHYAKVFYWTYYMEHNCSHADDKTMGGAFVADPANGTEGIENYITAAMWAAPGAFIDWTVANAANKYLDADDGNVDAAIRKKYSYDGSDTVEQFSVVPKACSLGTEVTRILCRQAADYLVFDHEEGQATGGLRVVVQDKHTVGDGCMSLSFTSIVVTVIRVNGDGSFKDVTELAKDEGYGGGGNRYVVPGAYGTDYDKAIVVITEYSNSAGGDGDVYKYGATGSLP